MAQGSLACDAAIPFSSPISLFRPSRDITCDGSVMAETAEIRRCDGVMDRIDMRFQNGNNG
jgi:hypothetical protein